MGHDMAAQKGYLDFDLYLSREGDRYFAEVRGSPAGPAEKALVRFPFGTDLLETTRLALENAVIRARLKNELRGGPVSSDEKILQQFGAGVFRAVFQETLSVATKFASSLDMVRDKAEEIDGLRLKLHVEPPELAMLPWEFMFDNSLRDDDAYLCLRYRSPLVRFLDVAGPHTTLQIDGPLRILGMVSNPGVPGWEKLDTEAERERIETALKGVPPGTVDFKWVPGGSPDDLFDFIQEGSWHIFHFIGHGGVDEYIDEEGQTRTRGFVVMQDGHGGAVKVYGSRLGVMLQGNGSLRLAVLNCCDGARGAFSSAGAALVSWDLPMVVAMQFPISNDAAADFAGRFYKSIVSGQSVERALTTTRQFMRSRSNLEWGIPVLFSRSGSSLLFQVESRDSEGPVSPQAVLTQQAGGNALAREELRRLFS
jgi:hypothetical protein